MEIYDRLIINYNKSFLLLQAIRQRFLYSRPAISYLPDAANTGEPGFEEIFPLKMYNKY